MVLKVSNMLMILLFIRNLEILAWFSKWIIMNSFNISLKYKISCVNKLYFVIRPVTLIKYLFILIND